MGGSMASRWCLLWSVGVTTGRGVLLECRVRPDFRRSRSVLRLVFNVPRPATFIFIRRESAFSGLFQYDTFHLRCLCASCVAGYICFAKVLIRSSNTFLASEQSQLPFSTAYMLLACTKPMNLRFKFYAYGLKQRKRMMCTERRTGQSRRMQQPGGGVPPLAAAS